MFDTDTKRNNPLRTFWPDVSDADGALEAITLGYWACFILAGLNAVMGLLASPALLLDAGTYAVLGMFVRRKSRTAALVAAAYMTLNVVLSILRVPLVGVITLILYACVLSSVRGTFAYRRLTVAPAVTSNQDVNSGTTV